LKRPSASLSNRWVTHEMNAGTPIVMAHAADAKFCSGTAEEMRAHCIVCHYYLLNICFIRAQRPCALSGTSSSPIYKQKCTTPLVSVYPS
jgi:hypothetical protein